MTTTEISCDKPSFNNAAEVAPVIACINATTRVTDYEIAAVAAALQIQVTRDFSPQYGKTASVVSVKNGSKPPKGSWWLVFTDTSDEAGALGYHDLTPQDQPVGKVFVETTKKYGGIWSVTASHEILEMLADPSLVKTACVETRSSSKLYAWEVCDACEADDLGYEINGVKVSDFVFESWFDPHAKGPFDFCRRIKKPLQLLPGGYISVMDLKNAGSWTQVTADHLNARLPYGDRARVGSRREKRRTHKDHWERSTAHEE